MIRLLTNIIVFPISLYQYLKKKHHIIKQHNQALSKQNTFQLKRKNKQ